MAKRILIVDDFEINRITIKNMLFDLGFEKIIGVSNGYSALANLKSKIFDCVIAELEMSDMSGLELLKKIRTDQLLKKMPVLITTEDCSRENIVSVAKAGATGYILKPFKRNEFSEKLNMIFFEG